MASETMQDALFALGRAGVRPVVAPTLAANLERTADALETAVRDDVPAFVQTGNPEILPELRDHADALLGEVHRLVGGATTARLEFVRRHAARKAEQRFPLEALLHAYRVALKVIGHWLRSAAQDEPGASPDRHEARVAAGEFAIEFMDTVSTIATSEYVRRTRQLSETEADRRSQLLALLLEGYDESDGRIARLLRSAGYLDQRQSFCVVVARPIDVREMQNSARANRLLAATRKALDELPLRALYGFHRDYVVAVVSALRRLSGWTAPRAELAGRVSWPMLTLGNSVLVGVSADVPSTARIPHALHEAELALEVADASQRVVEYAKIPLRTLLLNLAEDNLRAAIPAWANALKAADRKSRGVLLETMKTYADADMNVLKAAKLLGVHPNTIYARMQKIRDVTARDPLSYHGLSEMLLAIDCMGADN